MAKDTVSPQIDRIARRRRVLGSSSPSHAGSWIAGTLLAIVATTASGIWVFLPPEGLGKNLGPLNVPLKKGDPRLIDVKKADPRKVVEAPIPVVEGKLINGIFHMANSFGVLDADKPRTFIIPIEADQGYVLTLRSIDVDVDVNHGGPESLRAQKGQTAVHKFRSREAGNLKLIVRGRTPGAYQITLKDDTIGFEWTPRPLSFVKVPDSIETMTEIAGAPSKRMGVKVTPLKIDAAKLMHQMQWDNAGDFLFTLTSEGVLQRIRSADWVEERRLELAQRTGDLALSARGLLVEMTDLQEVWVVEPSTLTVRHRYSTPPVYRLLSGPTLDFAMIRSNGMVVRLELAKDLPFRAFTAPTHLAAMTPDGKWYFAVGGTVGIPQLVAYRVESKRLVKAESTAHVSNAHWINVSPDSKFMCLPAYDGYVAAATPVFEVGNLSAPGFTLQSGPHPKLVAFDPVAKLIYTQNQAHQLVVLSQPGVIQSEHILTTSGDHPRQFAVHPKGKKLVVVTGAQAMFVELP